MGPTSTSSSSPQGLRSNTPSKLRRTCRGPVSYLCHAWNCTSASRTTTRSLSSHPPAQRELPWRLVSQPPGTSTPPRLWELTDLASLRRETLSCRSLELQPTTLPRKLPP